MRPTEAMRNARAMIARMQDERTALKAEIARLKASPWVSVENRLPEPETMVLGLVNGFDGVLTLERRWEICNPMVEGYFKDFLYWDWVDNDGQNFDELVSHWMPMPELP